MRSDESTSDVGVDLGFHPDTMKTTAPVLDSRFVRRSTRIADLRASASRLVTVTAPAGYGKTSFLAEWRELESRAVGWITLSAADDDPAAFMRLLATASADFVQDSSELLRIVDAGKGRILAHVAPAVSFALSQSRVPFVLFIDDVHVLRSPECFDALDIVLTGVPAGSQIVWASRQRHEAIARGRLAASETAVLAEDLRLDVAGAAEVAAAVGVHADAQTLESWVARCEGWAAGIHMCALLSRSGSASLNGSDALLIDYLYSECLRDLPDDTRDFLLRTSILPAHIPELCDAVVGGTGAEQIFRALVAQQLFVTADREDRCYRLHPLFLEYLREELERVAPASVPSLHLRAAEWFQRKGQLPAAIDHAIAAREFGLASALVAAAAIHAYEAGQVATLERWLADIGDANLLAAPSSVVVIAWVSILAGSDAAAEKWGSLLDTVAGVSGPVDGIDLGSAQAMIRAIMMKDGMPSALRDAEYAVEVEPPASPWRDPALQILGSTLLHAGDEAGGRRYLEAARHTAEVHGNPATVVMCHTEFAFLAIEQEEWADARRHTDAALASIAAGGIDGYVMSAYAHAAAACVELHEGSRDNGREMLLRGMSERGRCLSSVPLIAIPTRLLLVRAHVMNGDVEAARIVVAEIDEILPPPVGREALDARVTNARKAVAAEARSDRRHDESITLTLAEQRVLPYLQTHLNRAEIAERLFVSRNTVGSQISAIFRKLDVSNRADAVHRATEIGLLG